MNRSDIYHVRHSPSSLKGRKCMSKDILATPLESIRKKSSLSRPILKEDFWEGYKNLNAEKLVKKKPRKNEYCLPSMKDIQRRKELNAEFNHIHILVMDTCNWMTEQGFQVSNNDRRNLSALMKTCFDPLTFSSIGKKTKELSPVRKKKGRAVPKTDNLSMCERFRQSNKCGIDGSTPKDYKKVVEDNNKIVESTQLTEYHEYKEKDHKPKTGQRSKVKSQKPKDKNKLHGKDQKPKEKDNEPREKDHEPEEILEGSDSD